MSLALRCIDEVHQKGREVSDNYGRLCHKFPIFVMSCGLCQALAFSVDKASKSDARGQAHKLLLQHITILCGCSDREQLLRTVLESDVATYIALTRRVLHAWIYFKRFAVSVLKVENAGGDDND
jgi:CRISPR-associated protein Cmr5